MNRKFRELRDGVGGTLRTLQVRCWHARRRTCGTPRARRRSACRTPPWRRGAPRPCSAPRGRSCKWCPCLTWTTRTAGACACVRARASGPCGVDPIAASFARRRWLATYSRDADAVPKEPVVGPLPAAPPSCPPCPRCADCGIAVQEKKRGSAGVLARALGRSEVDVGAYGWGIDDVGNPGVQICVAGAVVILFVSCCCGLR